MSAVQETAVLSPRARRRRRMRRRLLRRPLAVAGLVVALVFVLLAIFAPVVAPFPPGQSDFSAALAGPSSKHLFGTDDLGRDIFSRVIWGARASMQAGVFAVGLAAVLGPSLKNATLALGINAMPVLIRVTRGETLALREEDYVKAAVANGASDLVILGRHILPNMSGTLIVQATVWIPRAIIGEALLSFLGLGVQPPTPSWGVMLSAAQPFIDQAPSLVIIPGLAVFLATLSFNLLGDGLRDVLDPRTQT